jgi:hypothetical protein
VQAEVGGCHPGDHDRDAEPEECHSALPLAGSRAVSVMGRVIAGSSSRLPVFARRGYPWGPGPRWRPAATVPR